MALHKLLAATACTIVAAAPPRLIFTVLADDIGWADVGFNNGTFGRSVASRAGDPPVTPHMNALVAEGVHLTRHYAFYMCTPSRCSFLSGRLPGHVQLDLTNPEVPAGGIPLNMTTIASKMREANYSTAMVGKWDAGMATFNHTPMGRGFQQSLAYFGHKIDYWNHSSDQSACQDWQDPTDLWADAAPARQYNNTQYAEYIFRDRLLAIIDAWDGVTPLYLHYTPHLSHCPLQVPQDVLAQYSWMGNDENQCQQQTPYIFPNSTMNDYNCRRQYTAMTGLLDEILGNVTDAIKAKGVWNETLMVFSSDNGGPEDLAESAANNYPLRGMKYAMFEGGIRVAAFASGGYLPPAVRGTVQNGMMHLSDWYATFCALTGVDMYDPVAEAGGLPQPDGVDLWPLLSGANATSPRTSYGIDTHSIVSGDYKLIVSPKAQYASWSGPVFPNASSPQYPITGVLDCSTGCLFDVVNDPTEHDDIAAAHPAIVASMKTELAAFTASININHDVFPNTMCPANVTEPCACWAVTNVYNGFFGPFAYPS